MRVQAGSRSLSRFTSETSVLMTGSTATIFKARLLIRR